MYIEIRYLNVFTMDCSDFKDGECTFCSYHFIQPRILHVGLCLWDASVFSWGKYRHYIFTFGKC